MFFPIPHEESTVRRWPWVTLAILLFNVAVFAGTLGRTRAESARLEQAKAAALGFYARHSYLVAPNDLQALAPSLTPLPVGQPTTQEDFLRIQREVLGRENASESQAARARDLRIRAERQTLDRLVVEMRSALRDRLVVRYGNTPAEHSLIGFVSSQFLHTSWLQLLANLWFLWLVGCNVENRWGRVTFATFYLSAGVAAALIHNLLSWSCTIPVVGASGAVAGAMGAFVVRFGRARIRFAYWYGLRPGSFTAPAFLMLPLWAGKELLESGLLGEASTVAPWAHLGGFGYGIVFALVVAGSGVEHRRGRKLERKDVTRERDPALAAAAALVDQGREAEALNRLDQLRIEKPNDIDVRLEVLRAARAAGDSGRRTQAMVEVVGLYLRQGSEDAAVELCQRLAQDGTESALPSELRFRLARRLERQGNLARAEQEYDKLHSGSLEDESAFQALLAHAALCVRQGRKAAALALFGMAKEAVWAHLLLETPLQQAIRAAQALPDEAATTEEREGRGPDTVDDGGPDIESDEAPAVILLAPSDPASPQTSFDSTRPAARGLVRTPTLVSAVAHESGAVTDRTPPAWVDSLEGYVESTEGGARSKTRSSRPPIENLRPNDTLRLSSPPPQPAVSAKPDAAGRYSLRPGTVAEEVLGTGASGRAPGHGAAHGMGRSSGPVSLSGAGQYSVSVPRIESARTSRTPAAPRSPSGPTDTPFSQRRRPAEIDDAGDRHPDPRRDPRRK